MPLLWLSGAFLLGLGLGSGLSLPWFVWLAAVLLFGLLAWLESRWNPRLAGYAVFRRRCPLTAGLLVAFVALGGLRAGLARPAVTLGDLAWYNNWGRLRLQGEIISMPEEKNGRLSFRLRVDRLNLDDNSTSMPVRGDALVWTPSGATWAYGDRVEVWGIPRAPSVTRSYGYREYLARQGIRTVLYYPQVRRIAAAQGSPFYSALYRLRGQARRLLMVLYPRDEAELQSGILLGLDAGLPPDLAEAYRLTGLAHIIAISGFNISLLVGLIFRLFEKLLTRWWSALTALLLIGVYTLLVGAEPPVVRAAIMGGMAMIGRQIGRRHSGMNALAFTAAVMAAVNPDLIGDVSFQLSFTATLGMITLVDGMQALADRWMLRVLPGGWAKRLRGPLSEYFLVTLAAQLATLPVTAYHFHRFSLIALLANPLVLPLQPMLMVAGGLVLLLAFVWLPLARLFSPLAWLPALLTNAAARGLARVPTASLNLADLPGWIALGIYFIFLLAWFTRVYWQKQPWTRPALVALLVAAAAGIVWSGLYPRLDGRLRLTLWAQGGRSALLVRLPGGETLLIQSGLPARDLVPLASREVAFVDPRISALALATSAPDGIADLPDLIGRFRPRGVYWPWPMRNSRTAASVYEELKAQEAAPQWIETGQSLSTSGDPPLRLTLAAAKAECPAYLLTYGNFRLLLPGCWQAYPLSQHTKVELRQPAFLVLDDENWSADSPADWLAYQPGCVLWVGGGSPPRAINDFDCWQTVGKEGKQFLSSGGELFKLPSRKFP